MTYLYTYLLCDFMEVAWRTMYEQNYSRRLSINYVTVKSNAATIVIIIMMIIIVNTIIISQFVELHTCIFFRQKKLFILISLMRF